MHIKLQWDVVQFRTIAHTDHSCAFTSRTRRLLQVRSRLWGLWAGWHWLVPPVLSELCRLHRGLRSKRSRAKLWGPRAWADPRSNSPRPSRLASRAARGFEDSRQ